MRIVPVPSDGEHILLPFLELCCSWSMDRPPVDAEAIRADDHLNRYIEGWGRAGDLGVMALAAEPGAGADGDHAPAPGAEPRALGAVWIRTMGEKPGFGWVADDIPELSIAVLPEAQGEGLGRRLLQTLIQMAGLTGVRAISLAVEDGNGSRHLYEDLGFAVIGRNGSSDVMLLDLAAREG